MTVVGSLGAGAALELETEPAHGWRIPTGRHRQASRGDGKRGTETTAPISGPVRSSYGLLQRPLGTTRPASRRLSAPAEPYLSPGRLKRKPMGTAHLAQHIKS